MFNTIVYVVIGYVGIGVIVAQIWSAPSYRSTRICTILGLSLVMGTWMLYIDKLSPEIVLHPMAWALPVGLITSEVIARTINND